MTGNLYVNQKEFNIIMKYLVENYGDFSDATINLEDGRQIKAQPYKGGVEIMCNDSEIKKMLENIIEEND